LDRFKDPNWEAQKQAIQSLGVIQDAHAIYAAQAMAVDRRDRKMSAFARKHSTPLQPPDQTVEYRAKTCVFAGRYVFKHKTS